MALPIDTLRQALCQSLHGSDLVGARALFHNDLRPWLQRWKIPSEDQRYQSGPPLTRKNNEKYRNIMKHHLKYSKIEVVKIAGYSESYSIYFMMGIVRTGLYSIRIYHVVSQEPTRCGETRRPYLLLHLSLNNLLHIPLPGWSLE